MDLKIYLTDSNGKHLVKLSVSFNKEISLKTIHATRWPLPLQVSFICVYILSCENKNKYKKNIHPKY